MTTRTESNLKEETLNKVQDLITINVDSTKGFQEAADVVDNAQYQSLFRDFAKQRNSFATELKDVVKYNGETPDDDGSFKAKMHRWWIDMRGKMQDGDEHAILAEAERGEDAIKHMYEDVIKETTGSPINDVLHKQYAEVKKGHDRIRDLRDATA